MKVFKTSLKEIKELSNCDLPKETIIGIPNITPLKNKIINIQANLISHFVRGSIISILSMLVISDCLL